MDKTLQTKELLEHLRLEIESEFDGEPPPAFTPEQAKIIATAFYLLHSRASITWIMDQLIMLLANQDPEHEWVKHTFKNLARFLNVANHPLLTPSNPANYPL
jgi:hypothetical protein